MKHNHRFFSNKDCMFFPCHTMTACNTKSEDAFNCLFCYCPLYPLGEDCGGTFTWAIHEDIKIKLCTDCHLPHVPENYDLITGKLTEEAISALFQK